MNAPPVINSFVEDYNYYKWSMYDVARVEGARCVSQPSEIRWVTLLTLIVDYLQKTSCIVVAVLWVYLWVALETKIFINFKCSYIFPDSLKIHSVFIWAHLDVSKISENDFVHIRNVMYEWTVKFVVISVFTQWTSIDLEFVRNVFYFVSHVAVIIKVRNILFQSCDQTLKAQVVEWRVL